MVVYLVAVPQHGRHCTRSDVVYQAGCAGADVVCLNVQVVSVDDYDAGLQNAAQDFQFDFCPVSSCNVVVVYPGPHINGSLPYLIDDVFGGAFFGEAVADCVSEVPFPALVHGAWVCEECVVLCDFVFWCVDVVAKTE